MKKTFILLIIIVFSSFLYGQDFVLYRCSNEKQDLMDIENGTWLTGCKYACIRDFSEGLAAVAIATREKQEDEKWGANFKWGFIDKTGKEVIPCKYDPKDDNNFSCYVFHEGMSSVKLNGKYGFIDKTGKEIIPCKYNWVESFSDGMAFISIDGKWGYVDKKGKEIYLSGYSPDSRVVFSEGLLLVTKYNRCGYIDKTGNEVIPCIYNSPFCGNFSEGLARVDQNGKDGFIDKSGQWVIQPQFTTARDFSEGLAVVNIEELLENWKWGYIDKTGKKIIPLKYDKADNFYEGLAAVNIGGHYNENVSFVGGKWGYIDKTGNEVITCKYDYAGDFFNGFASVSQNNKNLHIDKLGNITNTDRAKVKKMKFSDFAKDYVEQAINDWQQKGEFEKTADWQQRVNEKTRNIKITELLKGAEQSYISLCSYEVFVGDMTLDTYDADHEVYLIKNSKYGNWLVSVPLSEAQNFKTEFNNITTTPKYFIENDKLALAEMEFKLPNGKTYKYSNQASLNYTVAKIDYNFAPIDINIADNSNQQKGNQNINTVNVQAATQSDVDINIPKTNATNDKIFAVIIANEDYQEHGISQVEFAKNDGAIFKEYCIKTLGLPELNVHYRPNATLNNMRSEIKWIKDLDEQFKNKADINIIFYYSGHGTNDELTKSAYLLPTDGLAEDATTAYKLDDLYQIFGNLSAKSVTVFLDACYSGASKDGSMLVASKSVVIKAKQGVPQGNTVVFSSSQGDETSFVYKEKNHGMFTYFLLKKLQESKGNITLGELSKYLSDEVGQKSVIVNRKSQTPTVTPSSAMIDNWANLKLK